SRCAGRGGVRDRGGDPVPVRAGRLAGRACGAGCGGAVVSGPVDVLAAGAHVEVMWGHAVTPTGERFEDWRSGYRVLSASEHFVSVIPLYSDGRQMHKAMKQRYEREHVRAALAKATGSQP